MVLDRIISLARRAIGHHVAIEPIGPHVRREAEERLESVDVNVHAGTAKIVLNAQLEAVRILRGASRGLDTKANLVIVASGALLTAFVTISPTEKAVFPDASLVLTLVSLAASFTLAIGALFVAGSSLPSPAVYNRYSTLSNPANEGKICAELVEAWHRYALHERRLNNRKADRLAAALAFLTLALVILIAGAIASIAAHERNRSADGRADEARGMVYWSP